MGFERTPWLYWCASRKGAQTPPLVAAARKGSLLWKTPLIGLEKTVAKMAGKPSKTKQPSLHVCKAHWDQRGSDDILPC